MGDADCQALVQGSFLCEGGGWDRLERDMETSLENYQDVVEDLQNSIQITNADGAIEEDGLFLGMCDIPRKDADRTLTTMAAQAFLYNRGSSRQELADVRDGETLSRMARDMRMRIYSDRVREKLAQWSDQGELLTFTRARAADIGQYLELAKSQ